MFFMFILFAHLYFLIFMKKLCLWLFDSRRYAKQIEAGKCYDINTEKYINCVTGDTMFQYKVSVNLFKVEIKEPSQRRRSKLADLS